MCKQAMEAWLEFLRRPRSALGDIRLLAGLCLLILGVAPAHMSQVSSSAQVSQNDGEVRPLELNKSIEREMAGGQSHCYQIMLNAGQYLRAVVDQRGIDVTVLLFGPDGKQILKVDSPNGTQGPEPVEAIAEVSGPYRLEVRSEENARPGRYEARIEVLRSGTEPDRTRLIIRTAAEREYSEGDLLRRQGTSESLRRAVGKYEQAFTLWHQIGELRMAAFTLNREGRVYDFLGEAANALECHKRGLLLAREIGDRSLESDELNNIGLAYDQLGEKQLALDYYFQALAAARQSGERRNVGNTLNNIALLYHSLGDDETAQKHFSEALPLYAEAGDIRGEAAALHNLGVVSHSLGDLPQALSLLNEALPLRDRANDRGGRAVTLHAIGRVYYSLGDMRKSLEYCGQALQLQRDIGDRRAEAYTLTSAGRAHAALGEKDTALALLDRSLSLRREVGDPVGEIATLYYIARAQRDVARMDQAEAASDAAIKLIESLRAKLVSQQLRLSLLASSQDIYELRIALLMQKHRNHPGKGYDELALQTSERARARGLLELLAEAHADIRQGIDPALLQRERDLQQQLDSKAAARTALLSRKPTEEQAAASEKDLAAVTAQYREIETQIRATSPRYAALTQPQTLSVPEIQALLDEDTLLLEYSLGAEQSYLWVVGPTSVENYQLPACDEIEKSARRVHELLLTWQPKPGFTEAQQRARQAEAETNYWPEAASLSRILLGPLAARLGAKRLVIVASGVLQYLPFGALPEPSSADSRFAAEAQRGRREAPRETGGLAENRSPKSKVRNPVPLVLNHEIISLPSASVLTVLRGELARREPAPRTVAVLADPVFDRSDPRVKVAKQIAQTPSPVPSIAAPSDLYRAVRDLRGSNDRGGLTRLPFSRQEAQAIVAVTSDRSAFSAVDFDASRATATSGELSRYRVVHFATHGLLDSAHPELSGLVFSLVNRDGQPQDGYLRLHEIFNLHLAADLVVLSACETGLGKEIKGEGLVGLTRGFMYAGSPRVVASLWQVDDVATAELMKSFYGAMFKQHMRPAAALRAAQIAMWKQGQWRAPYYWGAFVLQGDWK